MAISSTHINRAVRISIKYRWFGTQIHDNCKYCIDICATRSSIVTILI